jgi:tetratricopeptide (TPR) repeat protein
VVSSLAPAIEWTHPVPNSNEVFVSYAWTDASKSIVDEIQAALDGSGIRLIRDKNVLKYKDPIRKFMEDIGRGKCIVVVLSKDYLESINCMFELTQIAARGDIWERVFPVVMEDANIFDELPRLQYVRFWENKRKELDEEMRKGDGDNLKGIREGLDLRAKIRTTMGELTDLLADMNTLTLAQHRGNNFQDLIHALKARLEEDKNAPPDAEPAKPQHYSSLPHQPFFFGRDKERAIIAEAIHPDSRTWGALIDGPGGIGKTALAIKAGHEAPVSDFPRKIFLSAKIRELSPTGEQKLEDFMLPNYIALLTELARELGDPNFAKLPENERANALRHMLENERALIVIDNLETFEEPERVRLYTFLSRLPKGCKAIVTSRRRSDVDARIVRLDRLEQKDALDLLAKLSESNRLLAAERNEWQTLYEVTNGNPLLMRWMVSQLGRESSHCRTVGDAIEFLKQAPPDNDPLEYIFGDLLDTFTPVETSTLAALTHFTGFAQVKWIADMADLAEKQIQTALEDLADRAILISDPESKTFYLPPLAAEFLRRTRPEAVNQTGDRLTDRAFTLALRNGHREFERFPKLEVEWPLVAAAFPRLIHGQNARLQTLCEALRTFLDFSGRWDERLLLAQQAEEKAIAADDFDAAGWRAYQIGRVHYLRGQSPEVLSCAARAEAHWKKANSEAHQIAFAVRLRGLGLRSERNFPAALAAFRQALDLNRTRGVEDADSARILNDVATIGRLSGDFAGAEQDYREALRIATNAQYPKGVLHITGNLSALALDRGDWPAAERIARDALALSERIGRQELIGLNCKRLAQSLVRQGRSAEGLPYARLATEIFTKLRHRHLAEAQATLKECETR